MSDLNSKTCLVTGAKGYVGGELCLRLKAAGWRVIKATRSPARDDEVSFGLDTGLQPGALNGIDALIHCAYDFRPNSWDEIYSRNVVGTQNLLSEARSAGIKNIITVSSISAFTGCKSLYGKAKLEIEEATRAAGGISLRPGLVYGGSNRGMYGRLVNQVNAGKPVPLLVGSPCAQFLVHIADLSHVVEGLLSGQVAKPIEVWTVAHDRPWPLKELLQTIARAEGKKIHFLPVPWQFVWLALRCAESMGLKLTFKSDSVRSLAHQNLHPDFGPLEKAGLNLRSFTPRDA